MRRRSQSRVPPTQAFIMEHQLATPDFRNGYIVSFFQRYWISGRHFSQMLSVQSDSSAICTPSVTIEQPIVAASVEMDYLDEAPYEEEVSASRKRSKKRKIYCFNCNRQEFHIMAYKGTLLHSFLVGMSFGLARIFGPYRCTCCGKKRAMFADFCSLSYHWRIASERRLSKTGRRRSRSKRRR